jgi:hypothetical protein
MTRNKTPNLRFYSKVLDFVSKENADLYINAGWELIEVHKKKYAPWIILGYRVGWTRGNPVKATYPQVDETPTSILCGAELDELERTKKPPK